MQQIIKYKTSDGMEWEKRELAESHEKLLGLNEKIRDHQNAIKKLNNDIYELQNNCTHDLTYEPPVTSFSSRTEYNGPDSDDAYGVKEIQCTYTCCICNKEWTVKNDI